MTIIPGRWYRHRSLKDEVKVFAFAHDDRSGQRVVVYCHPGAEVWHVASQHAFSVRFVEMPDAVPEEKQAGTISTGSGA